MSLPKQRIHYLLEAYISKQANAAEENELMEWVIEAEETPELKEYMLDIWNHLKPTEDLSYVDWDEIYSRIVLVPAASTKPKLRSMRWTRIAAAAAILILLSAGAYIYFTPGSGQTIVTIEPKQNDVAPPSDNKAVLTLANGKKIQIDSSGNGMLAIQGNVQIIKTSTGEISYAGTAAGEVSYNTISVPRGSKPLNLKLSDGSRVWINVASSLTYPTAFMGKERKVEITGEAYFEVAHNSKMPFMVQHGDITVKVLGTHFNVNTYEDETDERITLLEGSVLVKRNALSQILKPGQQARISNSNNNNNIELLNNINLKEVMAWKDGKFRFVEPTDIDVIMRQISRWYDVDVIYEGKVKERFWGSISKDVNVSQVLKILEATGGVKFKVEGNKIMVMPGTH